MHELGRKELGTGSDNRSSIPKQRQFVHTVRY